MKIQQASRSKTETDWKLRGGAARESAARAKQRTRDPWRWHKIATPIALAIALAPAVIFWGPAFVDVKSLLGKKVGLNPAARATMPAQPLRSERFKPSQDRVRPKPQRVIPGKLLSDLGVAFEKGVNSPLVRLETSREETLFWKLREAALKDRPMEGVTLFRLEKSDETTEVYAFSVKDYEIMAVIVMEKIDGQWCIVGVRLPSGNENPFQRGGA